MVADGRAAAKFDQMVRETIERRLQQLEGEELLQLLGNMILRERHLRDQAQARHPSAAGGSEGTGQQPMSRDDEGLQDMLA